MSILVQWRRDDEGRLFIWTDLKQGNEVWVPPLLPRDPAAWSQAEFDRWQAEYEKFVARLAELGTFVHTSARVELRMPQPSEEPR